MLVDPRRLTGIKKSNCHVKTSTFRVRATRERKVNKQIRTPGRTNLQSGPKMMRTLPTPPHLFGSTNREKHRLQIASPSGSTPAAIATRSPRRRKACAVGRQRSAGSSSMPELVSGQPPSVPMCLPPPGFRLAEPGLPPPGESWQGWRGISSDAPTAATQQWTLFRIASASSCGEVLRTPGELPPARQRCFHSSSI